MNIASTCDQNALLGLDPTLAATKLEEGMA